MGTLYLFVLALIVNKSPFCGLFSATFFHKSVFSLVVLLFKIVPKCSAEVQQHKKAAMCLIKKICTFGKL